jgi:GH25 family lysozyme M1 (1,4-beta-N-acetylmuramidase)
MSLDGCDVASYQWDIEPAKMPTTDFFIVKMTQGTWYVNPYADKQYSKAKAAGKLLGAYHYGEGGDPVTEARYFIKKVGKRIGECILALDWEGRSNKSFNTASEVEWVKKFAEEVYLQTGVWIFLYMSKGVTRRRNWKDVAIGVRLWCAQYASNNTTDYQKLPWTDKNGFGAWTTDTIRQYSSHGRVKGYNKNLDINRAYMDEAQWNECCRGPKTSASVKLDSVVKTKWSDYIYKTTNPVKISNSGSDERGKYSGGAAGDQTGTEWRIRDWYNRPWNCVLRHPLAEVRACIATLAVKAAENNNIGYDQSQRESYGQALAKAGYDPSKIKNKVESDCSKGVIDNVKATGYILGIKELIDIGATYTGNMRAEFRAAGFQVLTSSKYLTGDDYLLAGDILLNDQHHTCTAVTNGVKSQGEGATPYIMSMEEYELLPLMKKGSKGNAVEHLQWMLNRANYKGKEILAEDGSFGARTRSMVISYQKAKGLSADGEAGPKTLKKLYDEVF